VQLAIPIRFSLKGKYSKKDHEQFLSFPLVKAIALKLNPENSLLEEVGGTDVFTVKDFMIDSQADQKISPEEVDVSFDSVLVGKIREFRQGDNIRIRVEWDSAGLCGDDYSDFALGDQVRMLSVFQ
jgi:hypothetical protein